MGLGLVVPLRVLTALPILRFPLAGFLLALEIDKWDWYWLDAGNRSEEFQALYQEWDKVLDLGVLGIAAIVVWGWQDPLMRALALGAFVWRCLGVGAFLVSGQGWTMVVFPNVFESLFLMYLVYYLISGRPRMLQSVAAAVVMLLAAALPKLAGEYFIHVLDARPWDRVNLPIPDVVEPMTWVVSMYLPALLFVAILAIRGEGHGRGGDRESQISAA